MISLHGKMVQWSDPVEILSANHIACTIIVQQVWRGTTPTFFQTSFEFVMFY